MILGIDAGFRASGIVVVDGCKVVEAFTIHTEKQPGKVADSDLTRCAILAEAIIAALGRHPIQTVVVEAPHGGAKGARALRAMALASGVVVGVAHAKGVPLQLISPLEVRKFCEATSKEDVQTFVLRTFEWPDDRPTKKKDWEHIADAAGAVIAWNATNLARFS